MTVDTKALQDLLERAVALEEAAAEVKEAGVLEAPATPSADAVEAAADAGVSLDDLAEKIAVLEDTIYALQNSTPEEPAAAPVELVDPPAADFSAEEFPEGVDFDDLEVAGEEKAMSWGACPECGSTNVDEFADGTARCEDCGAPLAAKEGKDFAAELEVKDPFDVDAWFEDLEAKEAAGEGELETKAAADAPATDTLTEMELLMARRASLDT